MLHFGKTCRPLKTFELLRRGFSSASPLSVYFLRGNDEVLLPGSEQLKIQRYLLDHRDSLKTSCMLYNPVETLRKISNWKQQLPWIVPYYAIKANPAMPLLRDLTEQGARLDCASRPEIELALSTGLSSKELIYSNPIKDEWDLSWANTKGVPLTVADSLDELLKIREHAPGMRILWRIAIKEEPKDKVSPFSGKFGDDIDTAERIHQRMSEIQELGFNLKGIHFHCGTGLHGSSAFGRAIANARTCIEIGRLYGHDMDLLDVGGGFPAGDLSPKTVEALRLTRNDELGYQVIAEPGRHMAANSFYLLTRVLGKRLKGGKPCYHLNDSLYHSFNCTLMDGISFEDSDQFYSYEDGSGVALCDWAMLSRSPSPSSLFGMTCDGMDVIAKNMMVPQELKVGDWLCLGGMGAYTYGVKSNFNGMKSTENIITWPIGLGARVALLSAAV